MKILIAGGSGFIGTHLLPALVASGHQVFTLTRSDVTRLPAEVTPIACDLRNLENVNFPNIDTVVHLAQSNIRFPDGADDLLMINCVSAVRLALAAIARGAAKFIYCSTGNVYGLKPEPLTERSPLLGGSFYAQTKIAAEKLLGELRPKLALDILRVFSPYGPGQQSFRLIPDIVQRVREHRPVLIRSNSMPVLSPLFVDDAVEAIIRRISAADETIINLAGSEIVSIQEIARQAGRFLQVEPIFEKLEDSMTGGISADNLKLRQLLGRDCLSLEQGIGRYIKWLDSAA